MSQINRYSGWKGTGRAAASVREFTGRRPRGLVLAVARREGHAGVEGAVEATGSALATTPADQSS